MRDQQTMIREIVAVLQEKLKRDYPVTKLKRAAHPKHIGLLKADFIVPENLPDELKIGLFREPKIFPALIRLSNANPLSRGDQHRDFHGFSLKLPECIPERTQDFLLTSAPTVPLGTLELFHAAICKGLRHPFLFGIRLLMSGHFEVFSQMIRGMQRPANLLNISYWSASPYKLGERYVKYAIFPTSKPPTGMPENRTPSYLSETLQRHLAAQEARFDFMVQFRTNEKTMPLDNVAVEWSESVSPFIKAAEIRIPKQKCKTVEREKWAELLLFTPANCLPEHAAVGAINEARIQIYKALAEYRHQKNRTIPLIPTREDLARLH